MIEDALKSTRTLHRLIMTVSLVTIVFALSISLPEDKAAQKQLIDDLIATDFVAYDAFVDAKVAEHQKSVLEPLAQGFSKELEGKGHLTFGIDDLGEAFGKPIHVGRLLTNELVLNEVSNASVTALNALNGLSLKTDLQVLVPRMDTLVTEIDTFLAENPQAGKRIDTIRITIGDFNFTGESFLPGSETTVGLYFELLDAVRTGGAPAFSANFIADIVEIKDSSFLFWLRGQSFDERLVSFNGDEVVFAKELLSAPNGFVAEKLGVLSLNLEKEIASSSPTSQSVSILGTSIPGALAVFASPIILIALAYYFSAHTGHLSRIVAKDRESFEAFSWLPISLKAEWEISRSEDKGWVLPFGLVECFSSAILLPIAAMGLLYYRLQAFGDLSDLQVLCLGAAALGVFLFGLFALRNVGRIRTALAGESD